MKRLFLYMITVLICVTLVAVFPVSGEDELYGGVIRLHILANSDSEQDQALKLRVRDYVLENYGNTVYSYRDVDDAMEKTAEELDSIADMCEKFISSCGYSYPVKVTLCREYYPTRHYEGFAFPAGEYNSLKIIIGSGEGHNWWCVLFPPMCSESAVGEAIDYSDVSVGLTKEQYEIISEGDKKHTRYAVRFKILEALESVGRLSGK
ncbi:MAG: stage II sporulation protein R [Eubacteriales bacterium]|nr:stage II sporulation protein R [Eubacteriales bacterium]